VPPPQKIFLILEHKMAFSGASGREATTIPTAAAPTTAIPTANSSSVSI